MEDNIKTINIKDDITKFTKEQFLQAKKYADKVDLLNVLLDDGTSYSFTEVDDMLKEFLEREVK